MYSKGQYGSESPTSIEWGFDYDAKSKSSRVQDAPMRVQLGLSFEKRGMGVKVHAFLICLSIKNMGAIRSGMVSNLLSP
jgi:hypothetical protein